MTNTLDPEFWLDEYGDALYRYVLLRIRDKETAEDLVQETLLAGIKSVANFSGDSSVKTWLIGILKHKTLDFLRKQQREFTTFSEQDLGADLIAHQFDTQGHWQNPPVLWSNPEQIQQNEQFRKVFSECLSRLPGQMAQIFILKEVDRISSHELCKLFNISTTNNLWVTLSRTRMKLRLCLESNWFQSQCK